MAQDLMFQDRIRDAVRTVYGSIPQGAGRAMAGRFYSSDELASVPEIAVTWALGVGNPTRHAGLGQGEVVLDVGCGGGIDTVLAARQVGPTGRVVGIDMLDEMLERSAVAAAEAGVADRCRFVCTEMESIPLPDAAIDVVISNGVPNLSPRKSRAFAEIARVMRPGGRLCVADLIVEDELPPEVLSSEGAWAGCISGALSETVLTKKLAHAGLDDVRLEERVIFDIEDVALYPLFTSEVLELMRRTMSEEAQRRVADSVIIHARKPVGGHTA